jgi:putative transcriptional regulator
MAKEAGRKRDIFGEIMDGIEELKAHREGRLTLRTYKVEVPALPPVDPRTIREVRERFHLSRALFARLLGLSTRTLEGWEQGRSNPTRVAALLFELLRQHPETLGQIVGRPEPRHTAPRPRA